MVLDVQRNHKVYYGRGEGGKAGMEVVGWGEIIYLSLHCHHQNDLCIKVGSDESHFNVSVGSEGQSHKTVSTERDGEKGGSGYEGCLGERLYTYRYTVTTRMTYALRWVATRAILLFHNCEGQSHKTVSTDHNLRRERRAEADSNRAPSAYQPNALPLCQTGSQLQH